MSASGLTLHVCSECVWRTNTRTHTERRWPLGSQGLGRQFINMGQRLTRALSVLSFWMKGLISRSSEVVDKYHEKAYCLSGLARCSIYVSKRLLPNFTFHESCSCWLAITQCKHRAMASGCLELQVVHTTYLWKYCGESWNEGRRGMPLRTYLHSDLSCSRSDSDKHPTD